MEDRGKPIFGRKVFFLNPTLIIENVIIERLRALEYEVYKIENYAECKPVLAEYEDSICFVNIDDQLTPKQWFNFIKSFEFDSSLSSVFLGVISAKTKPQNKEQFLLKTKLPGGFVTINHNIDEVYITIEKILDINGAKGLRKYVRYENSDPELISANCFINDRLVQFEVDDLSTAGFAARFSNGFLKLVLKGCDYNVNLKLGRKTITITVSVLALKPNGKDTTAVLMFSPDAISQYRDYLRVFICKCLQRQMDVFAKSSIKDMTNYSVEIKEIAKEEDGEKNTSSETDSFTDMGDLEEVKNQ